MSATQKHWVEYLPGVSGRTIETARQLNEDRERLAAEKKKVIEMEADMEVNEAILMKQLKVAYSDVQIEGAKRDYASAMATVPQ